MPLTLRPTGLGSGIDKDRTDYSVYTGEREVGRIYQTRGGPDDLRWFWSMTVNGPMTRSDRVATLEEAKGQFRRSWTRLSEAASATRRPGVCRDGRGGRGDPANHNLGLALANARRLPVCSSNPN